MICHPGANVKVKRRLNRRIVWKGRLTYCAVGIHYPSADPASLANEHRRVNAIFMVHLGFLLAKISVPTYDSGDGAKQAHHLRFKQGDFNWEAWVAAEGKSFVLKVTMTGRTIPAQPPGNDPLTDTLYHLLHPALGGCHREFQSHRA